jgi:hypothetical protein
MEEAIQGIILEAGHRTLEMVIKETDEQITEKETKSWQNVGTVERWLVSSVGTLRYKRRVYTNKYLVEIYEKLTRWILKIPESLARFG